MKAVADDPTKPDPHVILIYIGGIFLDGLMLMLLLGVLHASAHIVPAFGYWQSFFGAYVLGLSDSFLVWARVQKLGRLVKEQSAVNAGVQALAGLLNKSK